MNQKSVILFLYKYLYVKKLRKKEIYFYRVIRMTLEYRDDLCPICLKKKKKASVQ